jgi:tetratricopeptide (TPR) repeat protein
MSASLQRVVSCAAALALLVCAPVRAQTHDDLERAKASFKAGAAAYAAGEYPAAIQALEAAYELTPLPAIVFSLGQAERRQYFVARERAHLERAIELFRRYVAEVPSGGRSADALDALAQLEPLLLNQPEAETSARARVAPAATAASLPGAPLPASPRPTRLMITSEAPDARISVDGGPVVPSPSIHDVAPGPHRAQVTAEGFFPSERMVTALPGELILSEVVLRELPGTLVVKSSPDAELYIDGSFVSHGGERTTLALGPGAHTLTVAQLGRRTTHRSLLLKRGESISLHVELAPTVQRKFARGMFVAGGAALASGVVFAALAYRDQAQALDFLAKQKRTNVSVDELSQYRSDVQGRDRYRIAAGVSLATAATVFVCAVLMHELDRPSSTETQRRGDPSPVPVARRLQLAPQVELARAGVAAAGGSLSFSF